MAKMQVIKKSNGKVIQAITFKDDDCNAGMLMTPIYMNVQKWVEGGRDIISVNFRGGGAGDRKTTSSIAPPGNISKRNDARRPALPLAVGPPAYRRPNSRSISASLSSI